MVTMALLGTFALAACGPERVHEAVAEREVVATHAAAENTPDAVVFTADISGDSSVEMPPGELVYREVSETTRDGTETTPHRTIWLTAQNEEREYTLMLTFATDLEAGTHRITSGVFAGTQAVAAEFTDIPAGGSAESADAIRYNDTVEGSLTLDQAGETISGHFEFTAEATVTVDGVEALASIMAAGAFTDVAMAGEAESTAEAPTEEAAGAA